MRRSNALSVSLFLPPEATIRYLPSPLLLCHLPPAAFFSRVDESLWAIPGLCHRFRVVKGSAAITHSA